MKLRRITLDEVSCRARQETAKWLDRFAPALAPVRLRRPGRDGDAAASDALWSDREYTRTVLPRRFFPGVSAPDTGAVLVERFPGAVRDVVRQAERILAGRFDLLGYTDLDFGTPIDWHLDPVANRRASRVHWSRIDPLNPTAVGDSKVIWELNRHQWMVTLAEAYRITNDARFAEGALAALDAWTAANPYGVGINWASSLEVALRLISWCWVLLLLRESPQMTPARCAAFERLIRTHATHVERYLSHYFSPNTHLTGEALGLFYAGVVFAECPDAARWRDTGRAILIDAIGDQVRADGVYFEQASCYHRYTIEIYLHFLVLAAENHIDVPSEVAATTAKMFDWLLGICHRDGTMPAIGDADGGWIVPLSRRQPADCRGMFALGAVVFDREDLAWAAGHVEPMEVAWLLGPEGIDRLMRFDRRAPNTPASKMFHAGGYAVMRDGWHGDAHRLIVDTGPLGCPVSGAHGHSDLLSVQCTAFGEPYIIDPGTFCYTADETWRNYFRSTAAHNTVVVDGQNQADPAGPFSWTTSPSAVLESWQSTPDLDFVAAHHDAYARLPRPVRHRRRVLFVKTRGWVIVDDLLGAGSHRIDVRFHFSPRPLTLVRGWGRAEGSGPHGLWIVPCASQLLQAEIHDGRANPIDGWQSSDYGRRRPIPTLVFGGVVTLPCRVMTVLVPERPLRAEPPALGIDRDAAGEIVALRLPGDERQIRISEAALTLDVDEERVRIA